MSSSKEQPLEESIKEMICEYIKLGSVTVNDGCTDGKDDDIPEDEYNDDEFRK